jgi:hypothetical protein
LSDLAGFASKIDERNEKLIGYLRDGPQSLAQLAQRRLLYPPGFSLPYVESAELNSIRMHLDELVTQSVVRKSGDCFELA